MKHPFKFFSIAVVLLFAVASQASAQLVLRYAEGSPNRGTRAEALEYFADEVKRLSNGEMVVEIHWAGALLKFSAIMDGVVSGTVDMGTVLSAYNPRKLSSLSIGDIPMATSDPWVGMRAMYELETTEDQLKASLAKEGMVYVSNYTSTGVQFECTEGNEIRTVDDIKGKRMRASAVYGNVLNDLGASMVNMTYGDVYQALDTGLVDCLGSYFYTMRAYKTYEVISTVTRADWGQLMGFAITMNQYTWEDMTPEQQEVIRQAGSSMVDRFAQLQIEDIEVVANSLESGDWGRTIPVTEMSQTERQKILDATTKYRDIWIKEATERGLDGQRIWDRYMALVEKYEQERDQKGYPWNR
ncbi:C4-dicarboxylate TRAP transporter substrate-binding protein [Marinobacter litoralis]|uniref:C4-dicarboxylate TRAP transporter substrate-binding protein n=1 Tax=Marinobacter litoralis TaxID=187981 RepID=UPI0018ECA849|nr:C4-dicarboxylate TRAP transporter substrate-binding protein [Marinobacter litoralis]MBJ6136074.1 C4-dicarboxylate TRAP transporter substrate-binding protein [Marinobacter litoralis]